MSISALREAKGYDATDYEIAYEKIGKNEFAEAEKIADKMVNEKKIREAAETYFRIIKKKKYKDVETLINKIYSLHSWNEEKFESHVKTLNIYRTTIMNNAVNYKNIKAFGNNPLSSEEVAIYKLKTTMAYIKDHFSFDEETVRRDLKKNEKGFAPNTVNYYRTYRRPIDDQNSHFTFSDFDIGVASYKNLSGTEMCDFYNCGKFKCNFKEGEKECFYGVVLDGHGGPDCAKFISKNIANFLTETLNNKSLKSEKEIYNAFVDLCLKCDSEWLEINQHSKAGSTCSLVVFIGDVCWTINVGDSSIVIVDGENTYHMSKTTERGKKYAKEARDRGAVLATWFDEDSPRVYGELDMTTSLGDYTTIPTKPMEKIKIPGVSAVGTILRREVKKGLILIGSDGFSNHLQYSTAIECIKLMMKNECNAEKALEAAQSLVNSAFMFGANVDDATLMILIKK